MLSATGTDFAEVDPGTRIVAVRPEGGEAEIRGRRREGGAEATSRVAPTDRDLGWVVPPGGVVWTGFRVTREGAACHVELAPLDVAG